MKKLLIGLFLFCVITSVTARAGVNPAAFLDIGVGARALAMGGAYTAISDDATASYWNPAGLGKIKNFQSLFMFERLTDEKWPGMEDIAPSYQFVSIVLPCSKIGIAKKGTLALSVLTFGMDNIPHTYVDTTGKIVRDTFKDTESAYFISYGVPLFVKDFYVGGSLKLISQKFTDIDGGNAFGWDLDAGAMVSLTENLNFGLIVRRGPELKWDNGHIDKDLLSSKLGISYNYKLKSKIQWLNTVDLIQKKEMPLMASFGMELSYKTVLDIAFGKLRSASFRAGVNKFTLEDRYGYADKLNNKIRWNIGGGVGVNIYTWMLKLDYTFGYHVLGSKNRVSILLEI